MKPQLLVMQVIKFCSDRANSPEDRINFIQQKYTQQVGAGGVTRAWTGCVTGVGRPRSFPASVLPVQRIAAHVADTLPPSSLVHQLSELLRMERQLLDLQREHEVVSKEKDKGEGAEECYRRGGEGTAGGSGSGCVQRWRSSGE
mgnify:CR=1 FL=1